MIRATRAETMLASDIIAAAQQPKLAEALGLSDESRVVVVVCEGATDPEQYAKLINS